MKLKTLFLLAGVIMLTNCQPPAAPESSKIKTGMVKVAILYPNGEDHSFDMDYYAQKHMPMVASLFGEPLRHYAIDKGMGGRTPDEPIPFLAAGYFYFDKLSDYEAAFGPNAEQILGDIPNYTNIQPVVVISEVIK